VIDAALAEAGGANSGGAETAERRLRVARVRRAAVGAELFALAIGGLGVIVALRTLYGAFFRDVTGAATIACAVVAVAGLMLHAVRFPPHARKWRAFAAYQVLILPVTVLNVGVLFGAALGTWYAGVASNGAAVHVAGLGLFLLAAAVWVFRPLRQCSNLARNQVGGLLPEEI